MSMQISNSLCSVFIQVTVPESFEISEFFTHEELHDREKKNNFIALKQTVWSFS